MRRPLIKLIASIISIDFFWRIIQPIASVSSLLISKRKQVEERIIIAKSSIYAALSNLQVLNGPFKGMKYPSLDAVGSSLYPKIIGSYEQELTPIFERIITKEYTEILDIGCAEGYYAVGFGLKFPKAKIYGYDINHRARILCRSMAQLNNTYDRLSLNKQCSSNELKDFNFSGKGLIISDCEGFEKELFTVDSLSNLTNADVLIEVHDFIDITISGYLESLFSETHVIHKIKSIDDLDKAKQYNFPETNKLSLEEKGILFAEGRPQLMEWFFCESKIG